MPDNRVPANLDYLVKLTNSGLTISDVYATRILPDTFRVQVYLSSGDINEYIIECDSSTFRKHYHEAIEYSGYGPRGFCNLIHTDICDKSSELSVPQNQFKVSMSEECFTRLQDHIGDWSKYGYEIIVSSALSGMSYLISPRLG